MYYVSPMVDESIQALADQQLDWEEAKSVRAYLENDPHASEYYNKILQQNKLLQKWWRELNATFKN